ncbi:MAG: ABC transporter permease, partial [Gammaproteobacteria bacterium]
MNTAAQWRFAARSLRRDWHSGELRVLALALVVAVASVTAIGFFTDRVGRAVERQAGDVIAADLKVSSNFALPAGLAEEASASGLSVAGFRRFASVVINEDDESQLVAVKAVSGGYPLRGQLELASPEAPEAVRSLAGPALPEPGTLWVSPQLAAALALEPGQPLTLGSIEFEVAKILVYEPDAGQTFFDLAPRVMMNDRDVDRAGLLGAGSRANHALLVAGESAEVAAFADRMRTEHPELEFTGVRDGSPQMRLALSRAERFLGLASVATVLLAGAAVALAVHHFALRQADASAVLRTLGAERGDVIRWLILRLAAVALVASLVGIAIGWLAQQTFGRLLTEWFSFALPAPGVTAPLVGFATAAITLAGFGLLPILRAGQVDVMRVLRR